MMFSFCACHEHTNSCHLNCWHYITFYWAFYIHFTFRAVMLNRLLLRSWAAVALTTFIASSLCRCQCYKFYISVWHEWDVGCLWPNQSLASSCRMQRQTGM